MKKAIVLIALMMIARPVLPVLDYIINYNYIATELCENKAKPQLHCNGKCHLAKQLAKASDTEKSTQGKKPVQETEVLFLNVAVSYNLSNAILVVIKQALPEYVNRYSHFEDVSVFRPPVFIS